MRVHLVQKSVSQTDLTPYLAEAQRAGADLVCFGELATTGCLYAPEELPDLKTSLRLFESCDLRVMVGLAYQQGDQRRNAYVYYYRGEYLLYHKINLFPPMNEPAIFVPGDKPGIWPTDFGCVGTAICYDLRFPEVFAALKEGGVERIFVPAAFPRVRVCDWQDLLVRRAVETGVMVLGINCVGDDGTNEFGGCTMVAAPDGRVIARADETSETTVTVEI